MLNFVRLVLLFGLMLPSAILGFFGQVWDSWVFMLFCCLVFRDVLGDFVLENVGTVDTTSQADGANVEPMKLDVHIRI